VSWSDPDKVRELAVVGSRQRIVFNDTDAREPLRIFEKGVEAIREDPPAGFGEFRLQMRDGYILSPPLPPTEPLKLLCEHFLACLLGAEQPITGGREGTDVVRVMEAIDESVRRRGAPVPVSASPITLAEAAVPTVAVAGGVGSVDDG
jgi:predicted dehydrogenase